MAVVRVQANTRFDQRLKQMRQRLQRGVPKTMKAVSLELHSEVMESFKKGASPWGKKWRPHSPATLEIYRRGGLHGDRPAETSPQLLVRDGNLRSGITPKHTAKTASVGVMGPARKYAKVHQFGNKSNRLPNTRGTLTSIRSGREIRPRPAPIPARPFFPITRSGKIRLPKDVRNEIVQLIRRALLGPQASR